jgi:hypothetical protein
MRHIKILFMWPEVSNNWQPTAAYAMKKDPAKFWLELTGLTLLPRIRISIGW